MSKILEFLEDAIGYDSNGAPASTTQLTIGSMPFQIGEDEEATELTRIETICQTDAVVDIQIIDEMIAVSLDFSSEPETFADLYVELEKYKEVKNHVTNSINTMMDELYLAQRNDDQSAVADVERQLRNMDVPFFIPTIIPLMYDGTVQITFANDPKFIFYTSDDPNQMPYKITMMYVAQDLFCRDDVAVYINDVEAELEAQREELYYLDEARKMEEEAYQAEFGANNDLQEEEAPVDKRLRGVRFK